ncbi:stretch-activated cation channel mid1 [Bulinus truncatus]|nr:stretch-activated cation channel mid1 [Bulinus truncatus]
MVKFHDDLLSQDVNFIEMEEELTCPVCLELFADPLMLPCSHNLECPACRESHKLTADQVNKLPKNLALENIVFRYQEIRSYNMSKAGKLLDKDLEATCTAEDFNTTSLKSSSEDYICGKCNLVFL